MGGREEGPVGSGCPIEGEVGSIQYRVLGQWGPAPWMWGTAGAGATHTLVREQGQRSAAGRVARLWPPLRPRMHLHPSLLTASHLGGWPVP